VHKDCYNQHALSTAGGSWKLGNTVAGIVGDVMAGCAPVGEEAGGSWQRLRPRQQVVQRLRVFHKLC
jgi:hypothetical protein